MVIDFDPTVSDANDDVPLDYINAALEGNNFYTKRSFSFVLMQNAFNCSFSEVPHGSVLKHGSVPAFFFYNWVFVCASLVEHMWKTRGVKRGPPSPQKKEQTDPKIDETQHDADKNVQPARECTTEIEGQVEITEVQTDVARDIQQGITE